MVYMWFTGINYYKPAVEKDRDFIFTTITTIWKPGLSPKKPVWKIVSAIDSCDAYLKKRFYYGDSGYSYWLIIIISQWFKVRKKPVPR